MSPSETAKESNLDGTTVVVADGDVRSAKGWPACSSAPTSWWSAKPATPGSSSPWSASTIRTSCSSTSGCRRRTRPKASSRRTPSKRSFRRSAWSSSRLPSTSSTQFTETLERIVKGGSVVDPALVRELVAARRVVDPLDELSPREREVLALMAEGRSNAGIARRLWVTEGTVEKHVHTILGKLRLPETGEDHRRVLAVITFLDSR